MTSRQGNEVALIRDLDITSIRTDHVPVHIYFVWAFLFSKHLDLNLDLDTHLQLTFEPGAISSTLLSFPDIYTFSDSH